MSGAAKHAFSKEDREVMTLQGLSGKIRNHEDCLFLGNLSYGQRWGLRQVVMLRWMPGFRT